MYVCVNLLQFYYLCIQIIEILFGLFSDFNLSSSQESRPEALPAEAWIITRPSRIVASGW